LDQRAERAHHQWKSAFIAVYQLLDHSRVVSRVLLLPLLCRTGSSAEGSKARTLAAEREKQAELFKSRQEDIKKQNQVRLTDMSQSHTQTTSSSEVYAAVASPTDHAAAR
jgi:hypothetical protein